ncbi:unnamed protein product [Ectocarpus sp. 12 AP-2014]
MKHAGGGDGGFLAAAMALDQHAMQRRQLQEEIKTPLVKHQAEDDNQQIFHQQQLDVEQAFLNGLLRVYLNQKERVEQMLPVQQLKKKCILEEKHQLEIGRIKEQIRRPESRQSNF